MSCPPLSELAAPDAVTRLGAHIASCPRCHALVARLDVSEPPPFEAIEQVPLPVPATEIKTGNVCTFWAPDMDEYAVAAVLDSSPEELLIVPMLMDPVWAAQSDLTLSVEVLGYVAVAAIWAGDHILPEQGVEVVNVLSEQTLDAISAGYDAFFADREVAAPTGPPVLDGDDPRLAAHAAAADELLPLYRPWAQLNVADELGPVMAHRRQATAELDAWSAALDIEPRVWAAFEDGGLDPYSTIPVAAMARAVRELGLLPSQRIHDLAHASVEAHYESSAISPEAAKARRRRGVVSPRRRDPEAAASAADQYADALAKELGL